MIALSKLLCKRSRATASALPGLILLGMITAGKPRAQTANQLQPPSPGQAIQDAARASVPTPTPVPKRFGNIEVLTDTEGIDFGPYLKTLLFTVRNNWYMLIPPSAQMKKGKLSIQFAILKTGEVKDLRLLESSGEAVLDRAAWSSITASDPFKPLPDAFHGPYLALRFRYFYNPDKSDLENSGDGTATKPIQHAVLKQSEADAQPIQYPEKAVHDKIDGIVRLVAQIAADGTVESVAAIEGNTLLGDAASEAIRKWRFQPARQDGKAVEDSVRIRVEFRMHGQQIRWELFSD